MTSARPAAQRIEVQVLLVLEVGDAESAAEVDGLQGETELSGQVLRGGEDAPGVLDDVLVVKKPRPHVRVHALHSDVTEGREAVLGTAQFGFIDAELPGFTAHGQPGPLATEGRVHPEEHREVVTSCRCQQRVEQVEFVQ